MGRASIEETTVIGTDIGRYSATAAIRRGLYKQKPDMTSPTLTRLLLTWLQPPGPDFKGHDICRSNTFNRLFKDVQRS